MYEWGRESVDDSLKKVRVWVGCQGHYYEPHAQRGGINRARRGKGR